MMAYRGSGSIAPRILWPLHWWRWVVSFTPRPLYPRRTAPDTHWIGGWVGTRAGLDTVVKRKIPAPSGIWTPDLILCLFGYPNGVRQTIEIMRLFFQLRSQGTWVSIATRLRVGRLGFDSWQGQGRAFSLCPCIQPGSEAHPATFSVGTGVLSPGVKRPGREAYDSPASRAEVKNAWSCTSTHQNVLWHSA